MQPAITEFALKTNKQNTTRRKKSDKDFLRRLASYIGLASAVFFIENCEKKHGEIEILRFHKIYVIHVIPV